MGAVHPAGGRRGTALGGHGAARASSRSSAPTRSGAETTQTPTTGTPPSTPVAPTGCAIEPGDAVYLSLTVYGGPDDGRYSTHIVGTLNSRDAPRQADGSIHVVLSRTEPDEPDVGHIRLEDDAVAAITRDYLEDPVSGRRARWHVEADDPPTTYRQDDADLARRFRAMATWVREQASIVPIPLGTPNAIDPPYPVPTDHLRLGGGDAAYAMGSFELADDEALVIRGRSPACAFWNMCLWNPLLHTYNYDYERVTINGAQTIYEPDGSWTIVVAARRPLPPQLGVDRRTPQGPDLVPLVPPRRDARAAPGRGLAGGIGVTLRPAPVRIDDLAEPHFPDEARPSSTSWRRPARISPWTPPL